MKLNINNLAASVIDEVEGKATVRCLSMQDVAECIQSAEDTLTRLRIPKKAWLGCTVESLPPAVANAYKSKAMGTYCKLERFASGWFVVKLSRTYCQHVSYGSGRQTVVHLASEAHAAIPAKW